MSVIDTYLAATTPENRAALQHVRELVHARVPDVEEVMSYGMPGFRQKSTGKVVLGFAVNKKLSVYPHSGQVLDAMTSNLEPYRSALSALQFTPDNPLPDELINELLDVRVKEIADGYGQK